MSEHDFSRDLKVASLMADAARAAALPYFRTALAVENKDNAGFDPVTAADRAAESAMRDILAEYCPDDGICGEEFGEKPSKTGREWVLDPVDGTRAFISGLPSWTVLIALSDASGPRIGIIDQPWTRERFIGWPGAAELDREGVSHALKSRSEVALGKALMATTDPFLFQGQEAEAFRNLRQSVRLCRYGFDAYAYAMIATGSLDLVVESGLQKYDVQALIPVVEGAGGLVTDWRGGSPADGGQVIAAANRELHAAAIKLLEAAAL